MPKALKNGRSCDLVEWRDSLFSFLIVFEKHSKVFSLNLDRGRQLSTRIVREDDAFHRASSIGECDEKIAAPLVPLDQEPSQPHRSPSH